MNDLPNFDEFQNNNGPKAVTPEVVTAPSTAPAAQTTAQTPPKPPVPAEPRPPVTANDAGLLLPRNLDEAFRYAQALLRSKVLPKRFETAEAVMAAMQFAIELNLKPITGMRQIAVIEGTPAIFGDLPLSLCQSSGKLEWIKEWYLDDEKKVIKADNNNLQKEPWAAFCCVKRRGDVEPHETYFTMDEAKKAGLAGKDIWRKYAKRMLRYRARSQALKDKFADCLSGTAIAEYDFNEMPDENSPAISVPAESRASKVNMLLAEKP